MMTTPLRQRIAIIAALTLAATLGGVFTALPASAEVPNLFTGCVKSNGTLYKLAVGTSPSSPCTASESQISIDNGDITSVTASDGLAGGGTLGNLTIALATDGVTTSKIANGAVNSGKIADGSVTESKIADNAITPAKIADSAVTTTKLSNGAVTPDKISNDATEPSRIQTWVDETNTYSFNAYGPAEYHEIATSIELVVPTGKAYHYVVTYDCSLFYSWAERAGGSTGFYGVWSADLLAGPTPVSTSAILVQTGIRYTWDAFGGGSNYWRAPCDGTWFVRLTEGTHLLSIRIFGYSDNTMNTVHFQYNSLQVMRVP